VQQLALKFAEPAKLLIVIGIAYSLAQAGWYFVSGPQPQPLSATTGPVGTSSGPAPLTVAQIVQRNLFGDAGAIDAGVTDQAPPDTRLRLTLEGVFRADDPAQSAAIVAEQGRPGELYLVGATLPGNAVLTEVFEDRIVFRRGANFETLRFSEDPPLLTRDDTRNETAQASRGGLGAGSPQTDNGTTNNRGASSTGQARLGSDAANRPLDEVMAEYRDRLQSDPEGTLNSLGIAPVAGESAEGYRLGNLAQSPYLSGTGLQAGDVILSVNGKPVGNVSQDQMQINDIMSQGSARLEVQRGTRRFFVTASLR